MSRAKKRLVPASPNLNKKIHVFSWVAMWTAAIMQAVLMSFCLYLAGDALLAQDHTSDNKLNKYGLKKSGIDHLAVSVEPPGGSPTGQPTGPVVFYGKLQL